VIDRFFQACSIALHLALVALLGRFTFAVQLNEPREPGLAIEVIDIDYAKADPRPVNEEDPVQTAPDQSSEQDLADEPPAKTDQQEVARPEAPAQSKREQEILPETESEADSLAAESSPAPDVNDRPPAEEIASIADARQTIEDQAKPAPVPRLNSSALSQALASPGQSSRSPRINTSRIGSAVGKAAPRGLPGLTLRQKMDLAQKVRAQVMPCWNPPVAETPISASVRLRFRLDRQGRVVGQPFQSSISGRDDSNATYLSLLTNSGRRAVLMCAPFNLPSELYEAWQEVEVEFDPRDLR